MRWILPAWIVLLAGCASQPVSDEPTSGAQNMRHAATAVGSKTSRMRSCRKLLDAIRSRTHLGLERLEPVAPSLILGDQGGGASRQVASTAAGVRVDSVTPTGDLTATLSTLANPLEADDHDGWVPLPIDAPVDDRSEQISRRFIREIAGRDCRRIDRALGAPTFSRMHLHSGAALPNFLDERDADEQAWLIQDRGERMMRGPVGELLQEIVTLPKFEVTVHRAKSSTAATTSGAALERQLAQKQAGIRQRDVDRDLDESDSIDADLVREHDSRRDLGRVLFLVKPLKFDDPVDVLYAFRGLRFGTGARRFRVSFRYPVMPKTRLGIRSNYRYGNGAMDVLGTVHYDASFRTRLTVEVGSHVDLLTGRATYVGVPPEETRAEGVLFYVQHLF